ncbi:MAG: phosphate ABC transporter substrate-binding protein [Catonella sp.]|nr:phosphate ABC transporter substrate-binding protein [Catonella sp.]MDY6356443.1 phosphate ABC transporter substrate-binding protein [Catonella sp.]
MKTRKLVTLLTVAALSVGALAGCGDSSSASSNNSAASTTSTAADTTATSTTDSAAASAASTASTTETSTAASTDNTASGITGTVNAAGSSALQPLADAAAKKFMEINPDCTVTVNGGGSGEGLKQVADGSIDIGDSDVFADEKLDADAAAKLVDHQVATVTMAPVVSSNLGVSDLTTDQLISIFTGKTTNWKDVGGPDQAIVLVTRPSSSGTRATFQKWALNGEEEASNESLETDDSGTLLQTVEQTDGAIGYVALSYLVNATDVTAVKIDGVEPSLENTYNGTYKVWSYEHMYTNGDGSDAAQAFINYMTSDDFAPEIEAMGYGVASKLTDDAKNAHADTQQ